MALGATASFSVTATGTAPLTFQWKKGGTDIASPNTSSYTTPVLSASDNGTTYSVAVSNSGGSILSNVATLSVLATPAITTQPANQSVFEGQNATYSVVATGGGTLSYQWQRNSVDIGGAVSADYTLTSAQLADTGAQFRVKVTNAVGSATSNSAQLTVAIAPTPVAIASFTSSAFNVGFGASVTVSWTLIGSPVALTLNGQNVLGLSSLQVSPRNRQTFTLVVTGSNTDTKSVTIAAKGIDMFAGLDGGHGNLDGKGDQARFSYPMNIVADAAGNAYLCNQLESAVRKVGPDGTVTTLAGTGTVGFADGTGSAAQFNGIFSLTLSPFGDFIVADRLNQRIRKVTQAGVVTTLAGPSGIQYPYCAAMASDETLYVVQQDSTIWKVPVGGPSVLLAGASNVLDSTDGPGVSARFKNPYGILVDMAGNLYVSDTGNFTIRKITPDGTVSTLAGLAGLNGYVNGSGSVARFSAPGFLNWDQSGTAILVADGGNNRAIRKVQLNGTVTTVVQDSALGYPYGAFEATDGRLLISDASKLQVLTWDGTTISPLAGKTNAYGATDGPGLSARFTSPRDLVLDAAGNTFLSDSDKIRKITSDGIVSTLASGLSTPLGVAVGPDGDLVVVESGKSRMVHISTSTGALTLIAGNGTAGDLDGPGATAQFNQPNGVVVGSDGTIYVSQSNNTIRKISPGGMVSTFAGSPGQSGYVDAVGTAARFLSPNGLVLDDQGNLLVGEFFGSSIRKIAPDGTVSTWVGTTGKGFADGQGTAAKFDRPTRLSRDSVGNIYVSDLYNHAVRKVTPGGLVTTLVGSPSLRGCRAGALPASLYFPFGLAVRPNGDLLVISENAIMAITAP